MDVKDEEKKDPLELKTPTASAQDGGAQDDKSNQDFKKNNAEKEAWKNGWDGFSNFIPNSFL